MTVAAEESVFGPEVREPRSLARSGASDTRKHINGLSLAALGYTGKSSLGR